MAFAYGVDLGWASQLERLGYCWIGQGGGEMDPIAAAKEKGADSVRLRVFVDPPQKAVWTKKDGTTCLLGFCDAESVLAMAQRIKAHGMRFMIDFHYSDHFADPQYQDIPDAWETADADGLCEHVYQHTRDILLLLQQNGIEPDWVEVGNEINSGILIPKGSFPENANDLVKFLNSGYDAAKSVVPNCSVITHLAAVHMTDYVESFLDTFFAKGGKTDILGFSYYPFWTNMFAEMNGEEPIPRTAEFLHTLLKRYHDRYQKPIMIAEVGELDSDVTGSLELLKNAIQALKMLPGDSGCGIFYWEPEVCSSILPDKYPLGAARELGEKKLQYTEALNAYDDTQEG